MRNLENLSVKDTLMIKRIFRLLALMCILVLAGCAANQLPGFQNTYYSYNVPQPLLERIKSKFQEHGLINASIVRDNVGRVRLTGNYRNEDEVDRAFIIVQSIVGLKSTSPFYPENIKVKRWEIQAAEALNKVAKTARTVPAKSQKRALIIGINNFSDSEHLTAIHGEDDAKIVETRTKKAGYTVNALLGANATRAKIEAALRDMERDIGPDDSLFIYISSHGNPPVPSPNGNDERRMSIAAYDSGDTSNKKSKDKTDYLLHLQETSVSDTLVQQLGTKPTRNNRILIDTCYSGDMIRDISDDSGQYILNTNGGQPERASITLASWNGLGVTSKGIRLSEETLTTSSVQANAKNPQKNSGQVSVDRKRAGYTIMTATSEGELSWGPDGAGEFSIPQSPNKKLKGSFFTQSFFEYLNLYNGQVEPAFKAAQEFTQNKASQIPPQKGSKELVHQVPRHYSTISSDENNL